jgi:hypothetical protein
LFLVRFLSQGKESVMRRFILVGLVLALGVVAQPAPAVAAEGRFVRGVARVVTAPFRLFRLLRQRCGLRRCYCQPVEIEIPTDE